MDRVKYQHPDTLNREDRASGNATSNEVEKAQDREYEKLLDATEQPFGTFGYEEEW